MKCKALPSILFLFYKFNKLNLIKRENNVKFYPSHGNKNTLKLCFYHEAINILAFICWVTMGVIS